VNRFGRALEPSAAHLCSPAAELESHHSGQDGRVTIERQWERRHCLGRNLDGDFDAVVTAPVGQAAHTPTPLAGFGGGCMVLALYLSMVVWLRKF
jgi:hypothetical protein